MSEKTKDQLILHAAFEVFSEKSFHRARVDEIAEKAGVGKGTIYEYYKSKAHLFQEMYKWRLEQYFLDLEDGLTPEITPSENIHILIKNHAVFSKKFKNLYGKLMNESGTHVEFNKDIKQVVIAMYKAKMEKIKGIIEEGIRLGEFRPLDTELVTAFFFGSLGGISHAMMFFDNDPDPEEISSKVFDILLNGMKKE